METDKTREERWETEQDLDAFRRVGAVKKDKKRLARVRKMMKEQMQALEGIEA